MNCPHCEKPLSRLGLSLQFGAVHTCPECKNSYIINHDWKVMGIVGAVGFVISVVGLTVMFDNPPSAAIIFALLGIWSAAAMIAARAEKQNG